MVILKNFMLHINYFPWKFWLVLCTFYWISSHVKYPVRHLFTISYFRSLQGRHNFGKQLSAQHVLGVLYSCHLLIFLAAEGWGEKYICIEGVMMVKVKGGGGGGGGAFTQPSPPWSTLTIKQTWLVEEIIPSS